MKNLFLVLFLILNGRLIAQVGIGTNTPNASAQLEVQSTSKGLLLPRLTTTQINGIADPAAGLLVFNTTTGKFLGCSGMSSSGTISNTNLAGDGTWYVGLGNTNVGSNSNIIDNGQIFPVSNAMKLSSIAIRFITFNGGPGNIKISIYSGNTPGSGTLLGSKVQSVSNTGQSTFTFDSPIWLIPGNYYFLVHAETVGINAGLGYSSSQYLSGNYFQAQSSNGGAFSYSTNTNSLYFVFDYTTPLWENLN